MIAIASGCVITFPGHKCAAVPSEPLPVALPAASPTRASVVSVAAATAALSVGALRASPSERTTKQGLRAALISVLVGTAGSIDDHGALAEGIDSAAQTKTVEASNYIDTNPFDLTNVVFTTRLTTTRLYKDGVLASYIDDGFEPSVLTRSKHVLGKAYGSNHFQGHIPCGNQPVCRVLAPSSGEEPTLPRQRAVI